MPCHLQHLAGRLCVGRYFISGTGKDHDDQTHQEQLFILAEIKEEREASLCNHPLPTPPYPKRFKVCILPRRRSADAGLQRETLRACF